ncbi:MAG: outer membrane lipoprotein-sorting protein [Bacteroidetes bacterium GWC2_33_15]|nr:MAG: outer membrane lipoprotein-sorting protein [Bacteroidetes bacterium GWA2_33_15]OFX49791.1 MAG: outer membrane lipoprotein-sorting protein [Bacteroidetes bacterium GWC2_33_15]OFX64982.1 MAG: outer membrane lipoprotein-sorting protein [Bacteroidetes bacterium GWB2_32_14]OFX69056.1 MAG: outer membrane lipoprotein-sorting protein [Bacteroidetes bacterium GWD2_33_33]HAN18326.1 outer membrane lipoprotein-sorting protein [Bacteroidales bacterium]
MKTRLFIMLIIVGFSFSVKAQDATGIIKKADEKWNGEKSSESYMIMTIVRPTWERTIEFKNWTKGKDNALTLITAPAKEKGQAFLKVGTEMWNWMPSIGRMVKLPPSMMADGWMGSDYTNDDILKESSIVVDFEHKIIGSETIDGWDCWKIELLPHEDAAVVWGKIVKWISKEEYIQMKSEYFDEDEYLVKTEIASDITLFDGRKIPGKIEIVPADKKNQKTVVTINTMKFNIPIDDSFFSQQNMKKVR